MPPCLTRSTPARPLGETDGKSFVFQILLERFALSRIVVDHQNDGPGRPRAAEAVSFVVEGLAMLCGAVTGKAHWAILAHPRAWSKRAYWRVVAEAKRN